MTTDPGKGTLVRYNILNLPECVSFNEGKVFYHYDAAGRKLAKSVEANTGATDGTTDYVTNIVYVNNRLSYLTNEDGRVVHNDSASTWQYEYSLKDHLGNNFVTFTRDAATGKPKVMQTNNYYPFGLTFGSKDYASPLTNYQKNKYLYNGKEHQNDGFGGVELGWLDYGARMYNASLGLWITVDNLSERFYNISPYVYCANNPIRYIDPDGNEYVDAKNVQITYDKKTGWSDNATADIKLIHLGLMQTEKGKEQWEKGYGSDNKIQMYIVDEDLKDPDNPQKSILGDASTKFIKDENNRTIGIGEFRTIRISLPNIMNSKENDGLSKIQRIGATAGHEIEHTTEKNNQIAITNNNYQTTLWSKNESKNRFERDPMQVGSDIRRESRGNNLKTPTPVKNETRRLYYKIDTHTLRF